MSLKTRKKRLVLIDDDKTVCEILLRRIRNACPDLEAMAIHDPVPVSGHDIYVVDNDFAGRPEGIRLVEGISNVSPGASILMLSSLLEVDLLKRVIGLQCQGAFDKRNPRDMVALVDAIAELAAKPPVEEAGEPPRRGIVGELASLIREWNERIAMEELRRKLAS